MTSSELNEQLLKCRCEVLMHAELVNWQGYPESELPDAKMDSINHFAEIQIKLAKLAIAKELQDRLGRRVSSEMTNREGLAWKCSGISYDDPKLNKETISCMMNQMAEDVVDLLHLPMCDLTETISEFIDEWVEAIKEEFPTQGDIE